MRQVYPTIGAPAAFYSKRLADNTLENCNTATGTCSLRCERFFNFYFRISHIVQRVVKNERDLNSVAMLQCCSSKINSAMPIYIFIFIYIFIYI